MPIPWTTVFNILLTGTLCSLLLGPVEQGILLTELLIGYGEGDKGEEVLESDSPLSELEGGRTLYS
jgi:hypothetical protein